MDIVRKRAILCNGIAIGFVLGCAFMQISQLQNTTTYASVSVLIKYSDKDFLVWPARMKQERIQVCSESTVDWYEGELLEDWTFEQKQGCKKIVSYHEKGDLNASTRTISTR